MLNLDGKNVRIVFLNGKYVEGKLKVVDKDHPFCPKGVIQFCPQGFCSPMHLFRTTFRGMLSMQWIKRVEEI